MVGYISYMQHHKQSMQTRQDNFSESDILCVALKGLKDLTDYFYYIKFNYECIPFAGLSVKSHQDSVGSLEP
jgi:hypothetical protein